MVDGHFLEFLEPLPLGLLQPIFQDTQTSPKSSNQMEVGGRRVMPGIEGGSPSQLQCYGRLDSDRHAVPYQLLSNFNNTPGSICFSFQLHIEAYYTSDSGPGARDTAANKGGKVPAFVEPVVSGSVSQSSHC